MSDNKKYYYFVVCSYKTPSNNLSYEWRLYNGEFLLDNKIKSIRDIVQLENKLIELLICCEEVVVTNYKLLRIE